MNKEEEEAPLEDPRIRWNHLARERHVAWFEEQRAADANHRATQRVMRSDTQIALENVTRVNARMLLYFDTQ
jgi:hypothetical protein